MTRTAGEEQVPGSGPPAPREAIADLRIRSVEAFPVSFRVPQDRVVRHGIGAAVKRDTVLVKVTTECGVVGWGEAHHGRGPTSIADLVNNTLSHFLSGRSAAAPVDAWGAIYARHLASHGQGAGTMIALSGIDMALWDARGKYWGAACWALMGGERKPVRAYAGGVSLGFQPPESLVEEVAALVAANWGAVKLRFGDAVERDLPRLLAVRRAFPDLAIMVDANCAYSLHDLRRAAPALRDCGAYWLEEPFPAHDHRSYAEAKAMLGGAVPLAAGENHYGRFEFHRLLEDGSVGIFQPDLSKSGGPTEVLRIAHMAGAWKIPLCPHIATGGLNHAATVHLLSAVDNAGWFEGDASPGNVFRDALCPIAPDGDGHVWAPEGPGWGVAVDEDLVRAHPAIAGPGFV
jgi:L-alanine-DL-glutamate epimerase-like enolase superfamily enzyme